MKAYKGFNKDLKCRDFQYEIGKEYEQQGTIRACENGEIIKENTWYTLKNGEFVEV